MPRRQISLIERAREGCTEKRPSPFCAVGEREAKSKNIQPRRSEREERVRKREECSTPRSHVHAPKIDAGFLKQRDPLAAVLADLTIVASSPRFPFPLSLAGCIFGSVWSRVCVYFCCVTI